MASSFFCRLSGLLKYRWKRKGLCGNACLNRHRLLRLTNERKGRKVSVLSHPAQLGLIMFWWSQKNLEGTMAVHHGENCAGRSGAGVFSTADQDITRGIIYGGQAQGTPMDMQVDGNPLQTWTGENELGIAFVHHWFINRIVLCGQNVPFHGRTTPFRLRPSCEKMYLRPEMQVPNGGFLWSSGHSGIESAASCRWFYRAMTTRCGVRCSCILLLLPVNHGFGLSGIYLCNAKFGIDAWRAESANWPCRKLVELYFGRIVPSPVVIICIDYCWLFTGWFEKVFWLEYPHTIL